MLFYLLFKITGSTYISSFMETQIKIFECEIFFFLEKILMAVLEQWVQMKSKFWVFFMISFSSLWV